MEHNFAEKKQRIDFCRRVAGEGVVLLKNEDNILPLKGKKVAVFGSAQNDQVANDGSKVDQTKAVGITAAICEAGIEIDKTLYDTYVQWRRDYMLRTNGAWKQGHFFPEMDVSEELARQTKARGADTAIIVITRSSYENSDMNVEKGDYLLSDTEEEMMRNVCRVFDDVVLLLHIGCSIDLSFLDTCRIKGILYLNHLGVNGNPAMAEILTGKINPSGKLTVTLAKRYEDYPSSKTFGQHGGGLLQDYEEDVYVGYRYFESFPEKSRNVVYPFGFGLSYTTFSVTDETFEEKNGEITVTAKVTNTGKTAGKQVLQLYYAVPQPEDGARLSGPAKQLCNFEKTALLAPGKSQILRMTLKADDMASFDDLGVISEGNAWVMEKGVYSILLGTDSHTTHPVGEYREETTRVLEKCHPLVTTLPKRLTRNGSMEELPQPSGEGRDFAISAIGKTILPVSATRNRKGESFADCKAGDRCVYSLLPGTGGGYRLTFVGAPIPDDALEIQINGAPLKDLKFHRNRAEFALPLGRCEFAVTVKKDGIDVREMEFEKVEAVTAVEGTGKTTIEAINMYESDYAINTANFDDDGNGNRGSYITNFYAVGKTVVYKLEVKQAGTYLLSFKYATCDEEKPVNKVFAVLASNIVQPLTGKLLKKTYQNGEPRRFGISDGFPISLMQGTVYLKISSACVPFPLISQLYLEKTDAEVTVDVCDEETKNKAASAAKKRKLLDSPDMYEKFGIQLKDVYRDPSLMQAFLDQLSNRELATIVSGTPANRTPGGDVGCNHPLFERGVPAGQTSDGPCGLRQVGQFPIAFPVSMVLAATFNRELYYENGLCMAEECLAYDVDFLLGPSINILRNPIGGRNCSYYSEDRYLASETAIFYIRALQSKGVAAVLKHYTANSTEYERLKSNSRISGRALREIYLKAFERTCKESDPWCMMSSYNHVNDVKVCESYPLITEIPHDEWHWDGIFMTDWWNDSTHVAELKAGHDLKMATGDIDGVTKALDSGELSREEVYVCARRVLKTLMKIGRIKKEMEA